MIPCYIYRWCLSHVFVIVLWLCVTGVSLARILRWWASATFPLEIKLVRKTVSVFCCSGRFARSSAPIRSDACYVQHCSMSRKADNRYASRPRSLTTHYGSSPSMFGLGGGSNYNSPYSNNYSSSYSPSSYRNYNPYSSGFGRTGSNLGGIYGGTSSGYGGVYLGSLNLMSQTNILKKLDKKLLASQKNFPAKEVPTLKIKEKDLLPDTPPVRPERKSRASKQGNLNKERSRSLTSLEPAGGLNSRSISLNSLASDGYYVRSLLYFTTMWKWVC